MCPVPGFTFESPTHVCVRPRTIAVHVTCPPGAEQPTEYAPIARSVDETSVYSGAGLHPVANIITTAAAASSGKQRKSSGALPSGHPYACWLRFGSGRFPAHGFSSVVVWLVSGAGPIAPDMPAPLEGRGGHVSPNPRVSRSWTDCGDG